MAGPAVTRIVGYSVERSNPTAQSHKREAGPAMETVRFVGLDVHKDTVAVAVAEPGREAPALMGIFPHDVPKLVKRLRRLGAVKCCYEAGPTGFGLQRALTAAGIDCIVVAPALVPSKAGERVKTDRKDALRLARFLRSGDLTEVFVPDESTEAMRDLERARDDAVKAARVARHHVNTFLLRHGRRYTEGKRNWTQQHMAWLRVQTFEHEAQRQVYLDYLCAAEDAVARTERLTKSIASLVDTWALKPLVVALQAFRGINLISAVTLVAEVGDFRRFRTAPAFMSFTGLVPSEHSSGNERQQGAITRCGNAHLRRVLVESAWSYRYQPHVSRGLRVRVNRVSEEVQRTAWKAQRRLCDRYRRLTAAGKPKNKVVVGIARELAAFVWSVARQSDLLAVN